MPDGFDRLKNFEAAGHEDQHVAPAAARIHVTAKRVRGLLPDRVALVGLITRVRRIFDLDRKGAAFRSEDGTILDRAIADGGEHTARSRSC